MWLVQYIEFTLPLRRLLDLLPPQYSAYICVRWPDIFLAGTATQALNLYLPSLTALGPGCLACNWVFWPEWLILSRLGPAPARSYRMCMLDVFHCWTGVVRPRQNSTDSLFHHFPEHHRHTSFPSTTQPEPLPHQTKHVHYYCTTLPERADVGQAASCIFFNVMQ